MIKRVVLLNLLLFFLGCAKEKHSDFVPVYNVPDEFQPLIARFIQEAGQRGDTLAINNLIIKYDSSINNSYCALCNSLSLNPDVQKIITVNPKIHCYSNAEEQEALFFMSWATVSWAVAMITGCYRMVIQEAL